MTLAEKFEKWERQMVERARAQGERLGQRKGMCTTLTKLMAKRFGDIPPDIRQKLDGATEAQINRWADNLLSAPTLAEVFKSRR